MSTSNPLLSAASWNNPPVQYKAPIPLTEEIRKGPEFPVESLCPILRNAVNAITDIVDCPAGLAAVSVLGAASLAVQGHADIVHPVTLKPQPLSLNLLAIAESGERKTSAYTPALSPAKQWESDCEADYKEKKRLYDIASDVWRTEYKKILNSGEPAPIKSDKLLQLGPEPDSPPIPIISCSEPTIEGLLNLFLKGRPSLGLFSSEGGQFVGGYAMNDDNQVKTAGYLNDFWDGNTIKRVRGAKDEIYTLNGKRLTVCLMIQPEVARQLLSMKVVKSQGLFSRFLICFPESRIGHRYSHELKPESNPAMAAYYNHLLSIFQHPLPTGIHCNELAPRPLHFDEEAKGCFDEYVNDIEEFSGANGRFKPIRGFAAKMAENASRIASIMTLIENGNAMTVGEAMLENAIIIVNYFAEHLLSIDSTSEDVEDLELADKLLRWLLEKWPEHRITERLISIHGPSCLRGKQHDTERYKAISTLLNHYYLTPAPKNVVVQGRLTREDTNVFDIAGHE